MQNEKSVVVGTGITQAGYQHTNLIRQMMAALHHHGLDYEDVLSHVFVSSRPHSPSSEDVHAQAHSMYLGSRTFSSDRVCWRMRIEDKEGGISANSYALMCAKLHGKSPRAYNSLLP